MVFKTSNRLFIGLLLIITLLFCYILRLDFFLLLLIMFLVSYDFYKININYKFLIIILTSFIFIFLFIPYPYFKYLFILEVILIICIFFNNNYKREFFLISIYVFCLILLYLNSINREIFFTIIFISFFNDTLAYVFGKNIKGPLIIPKISPNKTWSGTLISTFLTFLLLIYFKYSIFISTIFAISLFFGDIFFSYIKRQLKIKDFSSLFGDHGGVLDRLDSMFFLAIIFQSYLVIYL